MYATKAELNAFLKAQPDVRFFDAVVIDLCGNAIGKRLPVDQMAKMVTAGTPVCGAMQLVDVLGNTADPLGHGFSDGDPDGIAMPLAGTFAPVPWSMGRHAQVLCVMTSAKDRLPFWYEPREVLRRVLARFTDLGLVPVMALELEFYLIDLKRGDGDTPIPGASPLTGRPETQGKVLSLAKLDEFEPVIKAMQTACLEQGIPVTTLISEYGAAQFEINLDHQSDALIAADHAALLRRAILGTARDKGFDATFMSKPFPDQSGSGLHLHLSLVSDAGENIFDPGNAQGDAMLGHAVAGLQATMAEAMAIFAPNINVYRRFKPDEFTPVTKDWGENNRSVAFRLPTISDGKARRLEHRISGAEANPYLVAAAVLAGAHYGLTQKLAVSEKATGNAGAAVDETLPLTLWQALDAFRSGRILPEYLGADYIAIYAAVKQAEFNDFMAEISAQEYRWYL